MGYGVSGITWNVVWGIEHRVPGIMWYGVLHGIEYYMIWGMVYYMLWGILWNGVCVNAWNGVLYGVSNTWNGAQATGCYMIIWNGACSWRFYMEWCTGTGYYIVRECGVDVTWYVAWDTIWIGAQGSWYYMVWGILCY